MIRVFHTSGDGSGWAIDEDLRQIRESLRGVVRETALAEAEVVHAPFWMALSMHPPESLAGRYVIAHADNPPFFYLKQPEFARAQQQVDLWVARSREAEEQFLTLGLPVVHIPYTIDPGLFFPLATTPGSKQELRRKLGLPESAYVIANFHRDSEGADLSQPKLQKAPELMVTILRRLQDAGQNFHVLLAGPRRHWIRRQLKEAGIPFTFVGQGGIEEDDFGINILTRARLNELYNAADLYLVPSRWEGGPQSVMEAAACRCKVLSTPLGVARDILEPVSLFRSASEAVAVLSRDLADSHLDATVEPQFRRWQKNHTTSVMAGGLRELYARLPADPVFLAKSSLPRKRFSTRIRQVAHTLKRRFFPHPPLRRVRLCHQEGKDALLDGLVAELRQSLRRLGIAVEEADGPAGHSRFPVLRGWTREEPGALRLIQLVSPTFDDVVPAGATVIAPAVQDVVNLRRRGCTNAAVVIPLVLEPGAASSEALVVGEGDLRASVEIWQALLAGRAVIYPQRSAYYEQVFHAGLPYENPADLAEKRELAARDLMEMQLLARPPERHGVDQALHKLLLEW